MTAILNRNRLLRLAGVLLLTAAIAIIPVGAAFADSRGGAQTDSAVFPPMTPINLNGTFREENAGNFVQLNWQDPEDTVNPQCYTAPVIACWLGGFGLSGHGPADYLDAPTEYVVERRQPRQQNGRGFYMDGQHDWTEIATLTGTDGGAPATSYRDSQWGAPSRTMEFRVKACNAHGCSGWTDAESVYIRWAWCAANANLCD